MCLGILSPDRLADRWAHVAYGEFLTRLVLGEGRLKAVIYPSQDYIPIIIRLSSHKMRD